MTLDAPEAQALAVLLSQRDALPRQAQQGNDDDWGAGPAEAAAAALADALRVHGTGAYARVLTSGQVSAGLIPQTAQAVVAALTARPGAASRSKRRGLGPGSEVSPRTDCRAAAPGTTKSAPLDERGPPSWCCSAFPVETDTSLLGGSSENSPRATQVLPARGQGDPTGTPRPSRPSWPSRTARSPVVRR